MIAWGEVDWTAEHVVILAQGPSFRHLCVEQLQRVQDLGACVIAVNGAIDYVPWADVFFSLDHSDGKSMERVRRQEPGVRYVLALPGDWPHPVPDHVTCLRRLSNPDDGTSPFEVRVFQQIIGGLSEDPGSIHTGNSAFGALGVAYLAGAQHIVMVGVDGAGRRRHDGTPCGPLSHMPELFAGAKPQLEGRLVVNASLGSSVHCFPIMSPGMALGQMEASLR